MLHRKQVTQTGITFPVLIILFVAWNITNLARSQYISRKEKYVSVPEINGKQDIITRKRILRAHAVKSAHGYSQY